MGIHSSYTKISYYDRAMGIHKIPHTLFYPVLGQAEGHQSTLNSADKWQAIPPSTGITCFVNATFMQKKNS